MKIATLAAKDFTKSILHALGLTDGVRLEWDRNEMACRNIFPEQGNLHYLKRCFQSESLPDGDVVEKVLFDRREESWRQFADEKLEPLLRQAKALAGPGEDLVLFRVWAAPASLNTMTGLPHHGEIYIEYVIRIVTRPPFPMRPPTAG